MALEDVVARADPHRRDGGVFPARSRYENEGQVGVALAQQIERHGGRKRGHRVVGDGDVPRLALQRHGQRERRVHALVHDVVAAARQRAHHERLVGRRVLDQQQSKQWFHNTRAARDGPGQTLGEAFARAGRGAARL